MNIGVGNKVITYNQKRGVVTKIIHEDNESFKMYLVKHPELNEEVWYKENHLNIIVGGDEYLTE